MLKSKLSIHLYPYLRTLLKYVSLSLFEFFLIIQIGFIIRQLCFFIHIVFLQLTRDDTDTTWTTASTSAPRWKCMENEK